jgi:hypothetical protein
MHSTFFIGDFNCIFSKYVLYRNLNCGGKIVIAVDNFLPAVVHTLCCDGSDHNFITISCAIS